MSYRSAERALPRLSVYAAAKATVEKFIEAMQREYARHKLVFTLVAPGSINTSFTANWPQKDRDDHNAESMFVTEAIKPILQALNAQYATNRISFESTKQWQGELGVVKPEKERKNGES
jgi:short-subunit dehydrogenase